MAYIDSKSSTREWLGRNPSVRIPLLAGGNAVLVMMLSLALWNFSLLYLNLPLKERARQQVGQISERVGDYMEDRLTALKQISQFYSLAESMLIQRQTSGDYLSKFLSESDFNAIYSNRFLSERDFQKFSQATLTQTSGVSSVMLTDTAGVPIWMAPEQVTLERDDVYWLTTDPRFIATLGMAKNEAKAMLSEVMNLPMEGQGVAAIVPLFFNRNHTGYVAGLIPFKPMIESIVSAETLKDFDLRLHLNGRRVYPTPREGEVSAKTGTGWHSFGPHENLWIEATANGSFPTGNQHWSVSVTPLESSRYSPFNALSLSIVALGVIVSILSTYLLNRLLWRAVRLQSVATDQMTRLERTGLSLMEVKSQLDLIMNSVDEAVILYDEMLMPVQANAAFMSMFPMTENSLAMKDNRAHHESMVRLLGRETRYWALFEALKRDPVRTFTDEIETPGSKVRRGRGSRTVLRRAMAVVGSQGELQGVLVIMKDVTTMKDIERVKDEFLSSVTHELRSPLASIKGFAEMIQRDPNMPPETRTEFVSIICEESARLQHLIEELLDLRKLQSQGLLLRIMAYDLRALVDDVVRGARSVTQAKSISIEVQWDGVENAKLYGDVAQMSRAIRNLVTNAVKYSPPGGTISIKGSAGMQKVSLEVQDQGTGIDEKDLPFIFDQFYRGSSKGHQKGTGLGLAIVKHTIELHGGHLGVRSEVGRGTSFRIELPREFDPPGPVETAGEPRRKAIAAG